MIGLMNEKTAFPMPGPEAKPPVDNLFQRKENINRETGLTDFQNYLEAVATDKSKPFRKTDSKFSDRQTANRREERVKSKQMDSPNQVVRKDKSFEKNAIQKTTDDKGEVSGNAPKQVAAGDSELPNDESQTAVGNAVFVLGLNPAVQVPVNEEVQPAGALTGGQSVNALDADELQQLQMSLPMEEMLNNQTVDENDENGQAAANQIPVDGLTGSTGNGKTAAGQNAATLNPGMTEAMEALLATKKGSGNNGSGETGKQSQTKAAGTGGNHSGGTILNSSVLEVFQDKVTAQATIQNLSESKDDLHQSVQNAAMGKAVASGEGNKTVNLAVLQTQLAVGENLDKTGTGMVMPLQQQQIGGAQFQETTQLTGQTAGKDQLFSQIMEHARLMLSGNQSELEMSLKPDHLGKLQLKVMVENQVVTARFVAESQQVKQIIETNLSQLRDQLRENGLQVDQLLVSVGNGSQEQFFSQTTGNPSQFGGSGGSHSAMDDMSDVPMDGEAVSTPKSLQETVIDLIA